MIRSPLILDTNLLILYVVGTTSPKYISKHKRLKAYTERDYDTLLKIIQKAPAVLFTPNILTEASNLLSHIDEPGRSHIFCTFAKLIGAIDEKYIESKSAISRHEFAWLGLTDVSLLDAISVHDAELLTTDLDLHIAAGNKGYKTTNFNHIRDHYLTYN